jgi:hypothetical protein
MTMWLTLPPIVYGRVGSGERIFSFALQRPRDLPEDFQLHADLREFSFGVFLPQLEGEVGQPPHPPSAILLNESSLIVASHGARGDPCQIIPLRDLEFVEYGHCLLQGWISFSVTGRIRSFPFNTRTSLPVEELLRELTTVWTPENHDSRDSGDASFGQELDLKFHNAESAALYPDERFLVRFFIKTRSTHARAWGTFPTHCHEPGDYLAITQRRILWITERNRAFYERYGSILRFAPLKNLTDVFVHHSGRNSGIICRLKGGNLWCIPLPAEAADSAFAFADQALSIIHSAFAQHPD